MSILINYNNKSIKNLNLIGLKNFNNFLFSYNNNKLIKNYNYNYYSTFSNKNNTYTNTYTNTNNNILKISNRPCISSISSVSSISSFNLISKMRLVTISNSIRESLVKHEIIPTVIHDKDFIPKGLLIISYNNNENTDVVMGNHLKVSETQLMPSIAFTLNLPNSDNDSFKISKDDNFTLVLTDPDAPKKGEEKWSEYCHYICKNIKLNEIDPDNFSNQPQFSSKIIPDLTSTTSSSTTSTDANTTTTDPSLETTDSTSTGPINIENQLTTKDLGLNNNGVDLIPYMGPGPPEKTGDHRYVFLLFKQKPGVEPEAPIDRPCWGTSIPGYGIAEYSKRYGLELLAVNFFYAHNVVQ